MGIDLTIADRVRSWLSADYAVSCRQNRLAASTLDTLAGDEPTRRRPRDHRSGNDTRLDRGWTDQPYGNSGVRTLSPHRRREMVRRGRNIEENSLLGASMAETAADNIIGDGMVVQAGTKDAGWNRQAERLWKDEFNEQADVRGLKSFDELQRLYYLRSLYDGDIAVSLLRNGQLQTIESDLITSPFGGVGDIDNIIEGVELSPSGRPRNFHVLTKQPGPRGFAQGIKTTPLPARNVVWYFRNDRLNVESIRGVPVMAQMAWLLEQVDGTVESVTVAHRIAASFGIIWHKERPGTSYGNLPTTATNADGNAQKKITIEPGMQAFMGTNEKIEQIKPEHPRTGFEEFMTYLVRMAGVKLGLPLELALKDFSKTNYSSARASMEQAYRRFRIEQKRFARVVLSRIYRWRVSKWMNEGRLRRRDDAFQHRWFGQQWPYLDPQKEAVGALVAMDAGFTTLTAELLKRGQDLDEWIATRSTEIQKMNDAGIPIVNSTNTRANEDTTNNADAS